MIYDDVHINLLKEKYLSEYLSPDDQAFHYICKRLRNELEEELGINAMRDEWLNYKCGTFKSACELCDHYSKSYIIKHNYSLIEVPRQCLIHYDYRKDKCSLFKSCEERFDAYIDNKRKLIELIQNTVDQNHVELYILIKIAQRKLIKYKKERKHETS